MPTTSSTQTGSATTERNSTAPESTTSPTASDPPRRTLTLTVAPLNLAGTAPYCLQLWFGIDTMHALGTFLGDVWVWLVMYLAAAFGWLLYLGMPVIVHFLLERSIDRRKARLAQIQKKLRAEWGDEVDAAGAAPGIPDA